MFALITFAACLALGIAAAIGLIATTTTPDEQREHVLR